MSEILKIGDILHRYVAFRGFWKYEVESWKQSKHKTTYYVKCLACSNGDNCIVEIEPLENGNYKFAGMIHECEEYADSFHHGEEFYSDYNKCKADKLKEFISKNLKEINNLKIGIESRTKEIEKYQKEINELEENKNENNI